MVDLNSETVYRKQPEQHAFSVTRILEGPLPCMGGGVRGGKLGLWCQATIFNNVVPEPQLKQL